MVHWFQVPRPWSICHRVLGPVPVGPRVLWSICPRAVGSTGRRALGPGPMVGPLVPGPWVLGPLGPVPLWPSQSRPGSCAATIPAILCGHSNPAPGPVRPFQSRPRGPSGPVAPVPIPIPPQMDPGGPWGPPRGPWALGPLGPQGGPMSLRGSPQGLYSLVRNTLRWIEMLNSLHHS